MGGEGKFLMGSEITAADCALCPCVGSLYHIAKLPVQDLYPNCWQWYQSVKQTYMSRDDWGDIKGTGCGFFSDFETFETVVGLLNCHRRVFTFSPDTLANQVYW